MSKLPIKKFILIIAFLSSFWGTSYATQCIAPNDWGPLCTLPEWEGTRCAALDNFKYFCDNSTVGCNGSCFGRTPSGEWYAFQVDNVVKRCRCGCVAQETKFLGDGESLTGTQIMSRKDRTDNALLTRNEIGLIAESKFINGVMFGTDTKEAYVIKTLGGKSITLSDAHPVLVVDSSGKTKSMKAASKLVNTDLLLNADGEVEQITSIEKIKYDGNMVNFNVMSNNALEHIVSGNDLQIGDNAWQQKLASVDSRIIDREEILKVIRNNK